MAAIYESDRLVREYLLFHYGEPEEVLPWKSGPRDALEFARRCVSELLNSSSLGRGSRALDLGCAVGRSAFELAGHCGEVIGIDFSRAFIAAAEQIRTAGNLDYEYTVEGARTARATAKIPAGIDADRVKFSVGDAMQLPEDLGAFDVVLAANLVCRLPDPAKFLARLPSLVKPGGQLLMTTPFTWLEEFAPKEKWIGGTQAAGSASELARILEPHFELKLSKDLPFLIREHARKYQWTVAWGTRWVRR
ncbi:MAG: putative 4-mercaptohistidine N1-methyltransferase [Chthoniobacterales bacterium]|nr:putative 4-mercaptohistidine N1-methyltransferase [Chthoniobacterales bacterium]